ncbi:hypothetical protein [Candidatus Nitrospira neomarina]|uniref:Uncharacterized protein n=1 Tax=Candidatus Nitrospira neomarina TaxID=3020899 RepID=A0AA96JWF1_9BACT|nr:hypothetical protein [Candidatus Nitrospira neomarina]WNM62847.1 hypothetical protein PQG83_03600 [Candidatus Nitrospira neomarina]
MTQQSASCANSLSVLTDNSVQNGKLLHSLSNKLLPIVVFSQLALRRCEDEQLKQQLEKIHGAAEQARDILAEIRSLHAARNP